MYNAHSFSDPFGPVNNSTIAPLQCPSRYSDAQMYQARRRPNRVSKPNSAGNSPHNIQAIGRRRTTAAHWLSRQRSSLSQGIADLSHAMSSRPISWHPSSRANIRTPASSIYDPVNVQSSMYADPSYVTAEMHGLVTPMSYPYSGEPLQQDLFPYLDNFQQDQCTPQSEIRKSYHSGCTQNMPWESDMRGYGPSVPLSNIRQPESNAYSSYTGIQTTAPPTPDFLPIQNFPSPEPMMEVSSLFGPLDSKPSASDLVGMGLYDLPSPTERTKSLILEESFVPNESDGDDEEGAEEAAEKGGTNDTDGDEGHEDEEANDPHRTLISKQQVLNTANPNEKQALEHELSQEQPEPLVLQSTLQGPFDPYSQYFPELSWPGVSQPVPCGWV